MPDGEPELRRGAAVVDGDLDEPARVLVPEGGARRGASPNTRACGSSRPAATSVPSRGSAFARSPVQAVAVVIDVDDLGEVVAAEPHAEVADGRHVRVREVVGARARPRSARRRRGRGTTRETPGGCPVMRQTELRGGARRDDREEPVVRPDVPVPVGAHDDRRRDRCRRRDRRRRRRRGRRPTPSEGREQMRAASTSIRRRLVQEIDDPHARREPIEHRLDLADVEVARAEVGEEEDRHAAILRAPRNDEGRVAPAFP